MVGAVLDQSVIRTIWIIHHVVNILQYSNLSSICFYYFLCVRIRSPCVTLPHFRAIREQSTMYNPLTWPLDLTDLWCSPYCSINVKFSLFYSVHKGVSSTTSICPIIWSRYSQQSPDIFIVIHCNHIITGMVLYWWHSPHSFSLVLVCIGT